MHPLVVHLPQQAAFEALHGRTDDPAAPGCTAVLGGCKCAQHGRAIFVRQVDNVTWFIQRRLAAVARFLPNGNKADPVQGPRRPAPLDEALARLGHVVHFGDGADPAPAGAGTPVK